MSRPHHNLRIAPTVPTRPKPWVPMQGPAFVWKCMKWLAVNATPAMLMQVPTFAEHTMRWRTRFSTVERSSGKAKVRLGRYSLGYFAGAKLLVPSKEEV